MSADRSKLPQRHEVDQWVRRLAEDVGWLHDEEADKCAQYRWAWSGLGTSPKAQSHVSGGDISDPTRRQAETLSANKLRRAAWLLCDAQACVNRARRLLTLEDTEKPLEGSVAGGWVGKKEMARLKENQARRQKAGSGYGDA